MAGGRSEGGALKHAQQLFYARTGPVGLGLQCRRILVTAKRQPIEYADASLEVRAVYDDIMATRKTDWVNNFWKVLAHDPPTLRRIWANIKDVMGPGTLSPLTKELLYVAVSASNGCHYCIASHGAAARKQGMTEAQYSELLAIVGLANETNRLVTALDVAVDPAFL
jgi:AhpD family alkylhydroperoxidase